MPIYLDHAATIELREAITAAALFMDLLCGKEPYHHRASQPPMLRAGFG